MIILAIDTSCDDTSVAISDDRKILSNIFWSKIKTHSKWGGVVPSEARRQHMEYLDPAITEAMSDAGLKWSDIDSIAVTYGPGLAIALEAGINKAKELSVSMNKRLIAVNHMIGHIYSTLALDSNGTSYSGLYDFDFPLLALTISGGHTDLYLMNKHFNFEHIGETLDDAMGEAFDKVGRMLGMGFPAGAKIEAAAKLGDPDFYDFPRPLSQSSDYNWSYSGLKTAVLYQLRKETGEHVNNTELSKIKMHDRSELLSEEVIHNIAASFQEAAFDSLLIKIEKAVKFYQPKMLVIGGGVIANFSLRDVLRKKMNAINTNIFFPEPLWLCTDNAAMIAVAANYYADNNLFVEDLSKLDRVPNLRIDL